MDRNDQVRKEPTLADLEAFEKLLRDSLQAEPMPGGVARPGHPPQAAQARAGIAPPSAEPAAGNPDQLAMAELARLIQSPLEFETPPKQAYGAAPAHTPEHHVQGLAEAALAEDWKATPTVATTFSTVAAPAQARQANQLDPLAAFEEELRRFDAIRLSEQNQAQALRAEYPGGATHDAAQAHGYPPATPYAEPQAPADHSWYADSDPARHMEHPGETQAEASLNAAENRLAAEAAAAAAASRSAAGPNRSRAVFLSLGGIALAGLAIIGGSFVLGSGRKSGTAGTVPVIAAKTEPAKEKPSDPGGVEIPNQNKQVLAARNTAESRPSQVVSTTEQPLDLNQVTRRDSVRIITPSPFQTAAPGGTIAAPQPAPDPAASSGGGPLVEPRRVTSVRIPIGGNDAAPTTSPAVSAAGAAGIPSAVSGATARPVPPIPPGAAPVAPPPVLSAPSIAAPVPRPVDAPSPPVKVESRPVTALARPETPKAAPPPKVAAAPAPAAPRATPPRPANAPLSLAPTSPTAATATDAPAAGSGYAIQLASRPTEADARTASTQLKTKYAATLGSRSPFVVSGEANGQTVYRVRVGGYSQAAAVEACTKVKAAGGGCFVTKQ